MILDALRAFLRWRFHPLAASAEEVGRMSAGAFGFLVFLRVLRFAVDAHLLTVTGDTGDRSGFLARLGVSMHVCLIGFCRAPANSLG